MPPKKKTVKAEAPPQDEDVSMSDAPALEEEATSELAPRGDEIINIGELRIRIVGSARVAFVRSGNWERHGEGVC